MRRRRNAAASNAEDEAFSREVAALSRADKDRASLAAIHGLQQEKLRLDNEGTSELIDHAADVVKRYIAIRDVVKDPENSHDVDVADILDDEAVIELEPFTRGWRLVKYEEVVIEGDGKGGGESE